MIRTVISLEDDQKAWLDEKARDEGKSMTAVVRDAVARYRSDESSRNPPSRNALLARTAGLWTRGDGIAYQRKLRDGWRKR